MIVPGQMIGVVAGSFITKPSFVKVNAGCRQDSMEMLNPPVPWKEMGRGSSLVGSGM